MKVKKIQIDMSVPIHEWAEENKGLIMDSIYDNVFEFMQSEEDDRIILQVTPMMKKVKRVMELKEPPVNVDFIISKDDIDVTLEKMLEYYIQVEEYEKCAKIHKLQNTPQEVKKETYW
jgi:hypothetical protein